MTDMNTLSIQKKGISNALADAWRQTNPDTLARLPWNLEILDNVTLGYITRDGTGEQNKFILTLLQVNVFR